MRAFLSSYVLIEKLKGIWIWIRVYSANVSFERALHYLQGESAVPHSAIALVYKSRYNL